MDFLVTDSRIEPLLHILSKQSNYFRRFIYYVSFILFSINPAMADNSKEASTDWQKYKSEYGITGFERNVEDTNYLESRAEVILDAPIEVILEILKDISSFPKWMYKCKEAVQIDHMKDNSRILYFVQEAPLGSQDRDVMINANNIADWDRGRYVISLHSIDTHPYLISNKVNRKKRQRMIKFSGKWDLRIIDRNHTKVIYTAFTNPGGFAPSFIVNSMIRKVSFLSLKGMIPLVKESRYVEAAKYSGEKKQVETALKRMK